MRRIDGLVSSQRSPKTVCTHIGKTPTDLYSNKFINDISMNFSIACTPFENHHSFYAVDEGRDKLYHLLCFSNPHFLDYELDKELSNAVHDMIVYGKAYWELITLKNESGEIEGISFNRINSIFHFRGYKNTLFLMKPAQNKGIIFCRIPNKALVSFYSKEVGYSRFYFRRLFRKLKKLDTISEVADCIIHGVPIDINVHEKKQDYKILKITKRIYWHGIKRDNAYLSEPYLLYRIIMFRKLQERLAQYCINKINETLQRYGAEAGYTGRLILNLQRVDWEQAIQDMVDGKINTKTLGDMIFKIGR